MFNDFNTYFCSKFCPMLLQIKRMQDQLEATRQQKYDTENALVKAENKVRENKIKTDQEIFNLKSELSTLDSKYKDVSYHWFQTILVKVTPLNYLQIVAEYHDSKLDLSGRVRSLDAELEMTKNINRQTQSRLDLLEDEVCELRQREAQEEALREVLNLKEIRIRDLEAELGNVHDSLQSERRTSSATSCTRRTVVELQEKLSLSREMLKGKLLLDEKVLSLTEQASKVDILMHRVAQLDQQLKVCIVLEQKMGGIFFNRNII
jgi:hypothetical protein